MEHFAEGLNESMDDDAMVIGASRREAAATSSSSSSSKSSTMQHRRLPILSHNGRRSRDDGERGDHFPELGESSSGPAFRKKNGDFWRGRGVGKLESTENLHLATNQAGVQAGPRVKVL